MSPYFVAGFETDGIVRRTAPILKNMLGMPDDQARRFIAMMAKKGWKASLVRDHVNSNPNSKV